MTVKKQLIKDHAAKSDGYVLSRWIDDADEPGATFATEWVDLKQPYMWIGSALIIVRGELDGKWYDREGNLIPGPHNEVLRPFKDSQMSFYFGGEYDYLKGISTTRGTNPLICWCLYNKNTPFWPENLKAQQRDIQDYAWLFCAQGAHGGEFFDPEEIERIPDGEEWFGVYEDDDRYEALMLEYAARWAEEKAARK